MKKEKIDRQLLLKAREAALYKVKYTMPEHNELPDEHVARCWLEAFQDVQLLDNKSNDIVKGYEDRIQEVKNQAEVMAIIASNDTTNSVERLGIKCHQEAKNPGVFFGYMNAVKDILSILEDWE